MSLGATSAALAALLLVAAATTASGEVKFSQTYAGEGTYYGTRTRGFGHCSFHFHGFGNSEGYVGVPLAINAAQYTGTRVCGQCIKFRGVGQGSGGNPIEGKWQAGFLCDQCPECKFGDIDLQKGGDGRWKVEWFPVQCPVGSSTFRYGFQGGNPWYKKMMVANGRVPIRSVSVWEGGAWKPLVATVDNYHEYHGDAAKAWAPCAKVRITSILGDTVEDSVCCGSGTCTGKSQFPCKNSLPSDDGCSSAQPPAEFNQGGIAPADGQQGGSKTTQEAAKAASRFNRNDLAAARLDVSGQSKELKKGETCGDKNGKWASAKCEAGSECKQKGSWWGCL